MPERPHDQVIVSLIDAVATGPVLDTGGIDRAAVECAEALHGIADNLARSRYRREHPEVHAADISLSAMEEGRYLLAVEGAAWLLEQGHVRAVDGGGLALGESVEVDGKAYEPGHALEDGLFHTIRRWTPKRLDLLRESVERLPGLKEYFPVLLDEDGHVVDGRHRLRLDPEWPVAPQRVPRGVRVAAAVAANRTNAWSSADWERLARHARFVHVIAKLMGTSRVTPPVTAGPCPTCGQTARACEWCGEPMPVGKRPEARTCSTRCRVALHRSSQR